MNSKFRDKEKKIIRTAMQIFARKGYNETNIAEIARGACIGKGTVYEYFKNKKDIFLSSINEWIEEEDRLTCEKIDRIEEPIEKLYIIGQISIEWFNSKEPDIPRMYIEIMKQSVMKCGIFKKDPHFMEKMSFKFKKMIMDTILEGVSKGIFIPKIAKDAETIAINFHAYLKGIGMYSMLVGKPEEHEEQVNFYLSSLIRSIKKRD